MSRKGAVPHPEPNELMEYARRGSDDVVVASHIHQCPECAREVSMWSTAIGGFISARGHGNDVGHACLNEHEVAEMADGSMARVDREAFVEHLAECAHCRTAVASVMAALRSDNVGREIANLERAPRLRWLRVAVPLTAAAVVTLLLLPDSRDVGLPVHRSPVSSGPTPVAIAPSGISSSVHVLRWHGVVGADRYRVTLFDGDGVVLWESALSDTVVGLPSDLAIEPGLPYYWIVSARTGFDRWDTSELVEFSMAAGGR